MRTPRITVRAAGDHARAPHYLGLVSLTRRAAGSRAAIGAAAALALAACSPGAPQVSPVISHGTRGGTHGAHTVSVSRAGRQRSELAVLSGVSSLTVGIARLGSTLLRASTPAGAGVRPALVVSGGTIQLFLDSTGTNGPAAVSVTLNSGVAWQLKFSGGSSATSVFLGHGRLRGADFAAGSASITMRLPRPRGTVTIVLAGGASQVTLSAPAGVPARLRLDGGASSATLDGRTRTGLAGGTVLTAPGWASAAGRYDIDAPAGISAITVGHW